MGAVIPDVHLEGVDPWHQPLKNDQRLYNKNPTLKAAPYVAVADKYGNPIEYARIEITQNKDTSQMTIGHYYPVVRFLKTPMRRTDSRRRELQLRAINALLNYWGTT